nr:hypothetical protein [Spirochaetota bacterium]
MKNTILIILSSLIFLFVVFVAIFGIYDIPKQMENDAEKILAKISKDLSMGNLKKETVDNLPKDFFYLIWIKNQKGRFVPLVYDKKISFHVENSPLIPLDGLSKKTKVFKKNVFKFEYIVWINKFKIDYYVKGILIPILFITIVYLILSIVFSFIFVGKKEIIVEKEKSFEDDEPMSYELSTEEFEGLLGSQ